MRRLVLSLICWGAMLLAMAIVPGQASAAGFAVGKVVDLPKISVTQVHYRYYRPWCCRSRYYYDRAPYYGRGYYGAGGYYAAPAYAAPPVVYYPPPVVYYPPPVIYGGYAVGTGYPYAGGYDPEW